MNVSFQKDFGENLTAKKSDTSSWKNPSDVSDIFVLIEEKGYGFIRKKRIDA